MGVILAMNTCAPLLKSLYFIFSSRLRELTLFLSWVTCQAWFYLCFVVLGLDVGLRHISLHIFAAVEVNTRAISSHLFMLTPMLLSGPASLTAWASINVAWVQRPLVGSPNVVVIVCVHYM